METEIAGLEARIVELETRLAFQDDTLEELNGVIIGQQLQCHRLEADLTALKRQIKQLVLQEAEGAQPGHAF